MKLSPNSTDRTIAGNDAEGQPNRPFIRTLFPDLETPSMALDRVNSSQPAQARRRNGSARPHGPAVVSQGNPKASGPPAERRPETTSPRGLSHPSVPLLARRRLSTAAYGLLESFREFEVEEERFTTYDELSQMCGFRSPTTIAKALKQLRILGAITTREARAEGRVRGLWLSSHGLPMEIPESTRRIYLEQAERQRAALSWRLEEVSGDIDRLEALSATQPVHANEAEERQS